MITNDKFDQVYEQYYRLMYHVAYGILQNPEDTEDALQEAFIRIDKNISKIIDPVCPKTRNFVVIIIKNVSFTMQKRKRGIEMEELSPALEDWRTEVSPERAGEEKSVQEMVKDAIRELPYIYRECLSLSLIEEYTPKEIADMLGKKEQSIYKRLKRGTKKLQEILTERGLTYED